MSEELESKEKFSNDEIMGAGYGFLAFTAWGLLPLYWKLLDQIPAGEILAHRIFWSFVFVGGILAISGSWKSLKELLVNKKNMLVIFMCAVIISLNWFTYIWAVNSKLVIEASMGYYINPLVAVLLGITILKEKTDFWQWVAIALAAIGVAILITQYGKIPWVALTLAITFAFYSLFKKIIDVDSISGLAVETLFLAPIALFYIIFIQSQGTGSLGSISPLVMILLFSSGVATATPLLWFAKGASKIQLSTIGFLQYLAPTISLILGIFVFKEQFTKVHFISFSFIWAAIIIYTLSKTGLMNKNWILKTESR